MRTLVAEEAMVGKLWCSAYQTRRYPSASARRAKATQPANVSRTDPSTATKARSRIESGTDMASFPRGGGRRRRTIRVGATPFAGAYLGPAYRRGGGHLR